MVRGTSLSPDAVVLTAEEAALLADRVFEVRCAAEDVATAIQEKADYRELLELSMELVSLAREAERLR